MPGSGPSDRNRQGRGRHVQWPGKSNRGDRLSTFHEVHPHQQHLVTGSGMLAHGGGGTLPIAQDDDSHYTQLMVEFKTLVAELDTEHRRLSRAVIDNSAQVLAHKLITIPILRPETIADILPQLEAINVKLTAILARGKNAIRPLEKSAAEFYTPLKEQINTIPQLEQELALCRDFKDAYNEYTGLTPNASEINKTEQTVEQLILLPSKLNNLDSNIDAQAQLATLIAAMNNFETLATLTSSVALPYRDDIAQFITVAYQPQLKHLFEQYDIAQKLIPTPASKLGRVLNSFGSWIVHKLCAGLDWARIPLPDSLEDARTKLALKQSLLEIDVRLQLLQTATSRIQQHTAVIQSQPDALQGAIEQHPHLHAAYAVSKIKHTHAQLQQKFGVADVSMAAEPSKPTFGHWFGNKSEQRKSQHERSMMDILGGRKHNAPKK